MAYKRYTYKIVINEERKISKDKCYYYDYGQTKGIELAIFQAAASIRADMTVKYDAKKVIYKHLFKDALLKTLLVHLLRNNTNLDVKNIYVKVYDNRNSKELIDKYSYKSGEQPIVYSMLKGNLEHTIREAWSKEEIENLLELKKSYDDRREAALKSFLNSKSKKYESERFLSLWMAFNGMYGHLGEKARERNIKKYKKANDAREIKLMQKFLGYLPGRVTSGHSDKVMRNIRPISVSEYNGDLTKDKLTSQNKTYKELSFKIENYLFSFFINLENNEKNQRESSEILLLESYTYLLTQFTYNFRCNYFHASRPLPLFMYADDQDLTCLMAMNDLLEDFLERNLHYWFSNDGIKEIGDFIDLLEEEEKNEEYYNYKNYFYLVDYIKKDPKNPWSGYEINKELSLGDSLSLELDLKGKKSKFLIRDRSNNLLGYLPENLFNQVNKNCRNEHKVNCKILKLNQSFQLNKNILVSLQIKDLS